MRCPTLNELPPPSDKLGWPWTEESFHLPERMPDGSEWPRISIVTPSYNQAQFLEETIRSVLLQGYPHLEYIIIDGGSSDISVEIIQKYTSWLAYWISEPDRGQADALNKGFAHATGEICAYLNSDDLLIPDTLFSVAVAFKQIQCQWLASRVLVGESMTEAKVWEPGIDSFPGFVAQQSFAQQGVFWRSEVAEKPYFDITRRYILDHCFFVRIYQNYGSPHILFQITAFFRLHETSKTSTMIDTLDAERAELAEYVCSKAPTLVKNHIHREQQRTLYKVEAHQLLERRQKPFRYRVAAALRAIVLLVQDPYPFRDCIFASVAVKLLARVFIF